MGAIIIEGGRVCEDWMKWRLGRDGWWAKNCCVYERTMRTVSKKVDL